MILRVLRLLGALSLLATGAVHLERYLSAGYNSIPTIGSLFLLNAIGAGLVALGLALPLAAVMRERAAEITIGLLAIAGAAIGLFSLVGLFVSENGTLFGFHEAASGSSAVVAAIVAEAASVIATVALAVLCFARASSRGGQADSPPVWRSHWGSSRT
jgi:hypothetical protein